MKKIGLLVYFVFLFTLSSCSNMFGTCDHEYETIVLFESTCISEGKAKDKCNKCNEVTSIYSLPLSSHNYTIEGSVDTGSKIINHKECSICNNEIYSSGNETYAKGYYEVLEFLFKLGVYDEETNVQSYILDLKVEDSSAYYKYGFKYYIKEDKLELYGDFISTSLLVCFDIVINKSCTGNYEFNTRFYTTGALPNITGMVNPETITKITTKLEYTKSSDYGVEEELSELSATFLSNVLEVLENYSNKEIIDFTCADIGFINY